MVLFRQILSGYYSALRICFSVALVCDALVPRQGHPASAAWGWLHSFSANHFKNWLFLSLACGKSTAWRLNSAPMGRQTTPPERAGELPTCKTKKQHNFLTGLRKKNAATPTPQKPDALAWGTRRHKRGRRKSICGGLSSNQIKFGGTEPQKFSSNSSLAYAIL